jgi:hypothetical protein
MKTQTNDRQKRALSIRRWLSCLRLKGEDGKRWLIHLKHAESEVRLGDGFGILFYLREEDLQFFIKKAERADIEKAWPSKKAEERYRQGIKHLVELRDAACEFTNSLDVLEL